MDASSGSTVCDAANRAAADLLARAGVGGAVVVQDARTGALVSYAVAPGREREADVVRAALPASVWKLLLAALWWDAGMGDRDVACPARLTVNGATISNGEAVDAGSICAPGEMLVRSCNTAAAEMAVQLRVPPTAREAAFRRFMADPRDTATPNDMSRLRVMLQRAEALDAAGTAHLLNLMARTRTGPNRLRAGVPAGKVVAHKTGSCGSCGPRSSCVNDVGIVDLPGDAGHAVIAGLVGDAQSDRAAEQAIAAIARAVYRAWSAPR